MNSQIKWDYETDNFLSAQVWSCHQTKYENAFGFWSFLGFRQKIIISFD